ncbi:LacI family DNA-binding transcriptional regulator [Desulfobacula sp.]|uniref:LacI family DNA-binding transcriptional regulator n=1 Tax=Desulfobacula sp. TaxID=2593537 RepID=UPI002714E8EC|nr:LacI family DNA-binding transcriptional regulator [Desulfobacula sp.]
MKRLTLKDLAKMTGFSVATVSRALNDHPRISRKTKNKIIETSKKVGYQPSLIARGFREKKSYLIGLIIYDLNNSYHAAATRSILEEAQHEGYQVLIRSTLDLPTGVPEAIEDMKRVGVDGIVVTATRLEEKSLENLIREKFPVVQMMRRLAQNTGVQIVPDGAYGIHMLVTHLLRLGHRKIAMIGGPDNLYTSKTRYEAYYQALRENDIPIDKNLVLKGRAFSYDTGYKLCKAILRRRSLPDAIVCADDHIAFGAMQVIDEAGLSIPEDIAIVGFDDCEMSAHPRIQLTSVKYDMKQLSRLAVKSILEQIDGGIPDHKLIKIVPQLVVRMTCGYLKE